MTQGLAHTVDGVGVEVPREYRTIDKASWGPGPWQDEPDKRQWRDGATGLPCLIVRGPSGALCGYVGVSKTHPAHGLDYSFWNYDADARPLTPIQTAINGLEVHGGLTYADGCQHGDDPARGICHIPAPGEPDDVWWFGFDCAHHGDASPANRRVAFEWEVYRDLAYVTSEVAGLAKQLLSLADGAPVPHPSPDPSNGLPPNPEGEKS
jgi:hypothetical protein